ncbi:hypothetical protein CERSUDRAFT_95990 [Gelatoporia subvermispora B]|uniref:Uncharacterized protein n=1 Tax=Ceriporiopsis subvermispora (strain B) TaxID=914234 RepID=M2QFD8_CERS8|nr:hypothetical protein CERSUDRAFT_95990 [Gelatoporia subvermispora B]
MDDIVIAPQFPVYIDPSEVRIFMNSTNEETDSQEEGGSRTTAENRDGGSLALGPSSRADALKGLPEFAESASFHSHGITIPLRIAFSQIIDTAILIPVIYEFKRSCHRGTAPESIAYDAIQHVNSSERQMLDQAAFVFAQLPHMEELIAVSGIGDHWAHMFVRRRGYFSEADLVEIRKGKKHSSRYRAVKDTVQWDEWSTPVPLGSAESEDRFRMIRKFVDKFRLPVPSHNSLIETASSSSGSTDNEDNQNMEDNIGHNSGNSELGHADPENDGGLGDINMGAAETSCTAENHFETMAGTEVSHPEVAEASSTKQGTGLRHSDRIKEIRAKRHIAEAVTAQSASRSGRPSNRKTSGSRSRGGRKRATRGRK